MTNYERFDELCLDISSCKLSLAERILCNVNFSFEMFVLNIKEHSV